MKAKRILAALAAFILAAALLTACNQNSTTPDNGVGTQDNAVLGDPDVPGKKPLAKRPWWDNWCRFSANDTQTGVDEVYADAATVGSGAHDEGIGPFFRETVFLDAKPRLDAFDTWGLKKMAWIEGYGDTKSVIGALHQLPDGTFEMDPKTGAPKIVSNHWGWGFDGPGVNKDANYIVWLGQPGYVNKEPWMGKYVIDENEVPLPTYPDGRPAVGYLDDTKSPWSSRLYDACAAKNILGDFRRPGECWESEGSVEGKVEWTAPDGTKKYFSDITFGKDPAAPFWTDYLHNIGAFFAKNNIDGYWVDNYNGWDSISNQPVNKAFGDWSEFTFKQYLKDHPEVGVKDPDSLNIRQYLIDKYKEWFPDSDYTNIDYGNANWRDPRWLEDPVWKAYLAHKSFLQTKAAADMYRILKEEARKAGRNPDDIAITGNDFCMMTNAAMTGEELDMVSTEYATNFHAVTGFNYTGYPPQGTTGGIYSLITDYSKSRRASVWYYVHEYAEHPNLGKLLGYEALAHNVTLNTGDNGGTQMAGNNRSARDVNKSIGLLKNVFAYRDKYAEVGVFYSSNSEYSQLAPGGYVNGENLDTDIGYLGWTLALEKLHVPYRTIQEYRLERWIKEVRVLIMPAVHSIRKDTIDKVLKPFLDNGGTIIMTGERLGCMDTRDGSYIPYGSNLLEDLARSYSGKGKIIHLPQDPAFEYFNMHQKLDKASLAELLKPIEDIINGLYKEGRLNKILQLQGFGEEFIATVNYDKDIQSFFVDVVNMNIDVPNDKITGNPGGKITVMLPKEMARRKVNVFVFTADKKEFTKINATVKDGVLTADIPAFEIYASLIIE